MALSQQMKNALRAALADPQTSEEVERLIELIEDLETRVEALEAP